MSTEVEKTEDASGPISSDQVQMTTSSINSIKYSDVLLDYFNPLLVPTVSSVFNNTLKENTDQIVNGQISTNMIVDSFWNFSEQAGNVIGNFFYEMESLDQSNPDEKLKLSNSYDQLDENAIDNSHEGVGLLFIHLISVFKNNVKDIADGNHYVLLSLEDNGIMKEYRTNTVFSSATPIFNIKWTVKMTNYRSAVKLFLVDATSHKKLSYAKISVYSLLQKMADENITNWKRLPIENYNMKTISGKENFGYLTAQILFKEDIEGF